ncbi:MAG TPA: hypothetical protein VGL20_01460 [Candidatus Dormibacteraeota bacterium]|jgi:membrane protein YqaA with SNARE-associated domain
MLAPALTTLPAAAGQLHDRWRRVAESDGAAVAVLIWAVSEATLQPIAPDLALGLLALGTRRRLPRLLLAAVAGMALGGICTVLAAEAAPVAATAVLLHLPLATPHGLTEAGAYLHSHGIAGGFVHQPWSGISFKVWAVDAGAAHLDPRSVIPWFVAGRAVRFAVVTAAAAAIAALLDRAHLLRTAFPVVATIGLAFFTLILSRVASS